ncbi:MAG: hypothetical protein FJ100_09530 [Deltaproteobacteria bacterium]|nr:hypothetical protein [Deltaproteobacteria bacterium]
MRHAIAALALWSGCGGAQSGLDPYPLHHAPAVPTFVVVGPRVRLYTAPDAGAAFAHDHGAKDDGPRRWLRVRGERGGWLAVSPHDPGGGGDHCAEALAGTAGLDLWLWVRKAEALEVLAASLSVEHPDGTGMWLRAGTPVGPPVADASAGRQWRAARTEDFLTAVAVSTAGVADRYQPSQLPAEATAAGATWSKPDVRLRIGEGELLRRDPHEPVELAAVPGAARVAAGTLYETRDRCGVYRVRASQDHLTGHGGLLGMIGTAGGGRTAVRAGSPLWWPDGRPAGTAVLRVGLGHPVATTADGYGCFAIAPFSWWPYGTDRAPARPGLRPDELAICVAAADLHQPAPAAKPR